MCLAVSGFIQYPCILFRPPILLQCVACHIIVCNASHPLKAYDARFDKSLGIVIFVKETQFVNADPILVTPSGITTEVREEQPSKAEFPILVTLLGILMEVRDRQYSKAQPPMLVTGASKIIIPLPFLYVLLTILAPNTPVAEGVTISPSVLVQ